MCVCACVRACVRACVCARVGGQVACTGGVRFSNSNRIISSDYRILLLLKMPIPSSNMFWGCFAASGTGCLYCVNGIMTIDDYQIILWCNVVTSVRKLRLHQRSWVFQQDNDRKHTNKELEGEF